MPPPVLATLARMATPPVRVTAPRPGSRTGAPRRRPARTVPDLAPWLVGAAALALRIATAARGPTDWDSAQYASAVGHFDVTHGLPQPPGYWLYVEVGGWVARLTGLGTIHALVAVAALASAAAAGLTTVAGRDLGGRWLGIAAGAVVATSPFVWFSGSIVATYSFDALACSLLVVLAWRARPGSWHGIGAVVALGLLAGFRPSILQAFALLALLAVVGATRTWRRLAATLVAGAVSVAVWFVPMASAQPGGVSAWVRATRIEADGAFQVSSVLDHAAQGRTNLGIFAAVTVVALAPVAALSVLAGLVLLGRRLLRPPAGRGDADPTAPPAVPTDRWVRPWYQGRTAVLAAAIVPPAAIVALVEFAKGGYVLAYLPAAVIALLLPVAALTRRVVARRPGSRTADRGPLSAGWTVVVSVGVALVVAVAVQRFMSGDGVLPQRWIRPASALWLLEPRYQAPFADTAPTIRSTDAVDAALRDLGPSLDPGRDVVIFDTVDGGDTIYRNAGWALPDVRIALIQPGGVLYNQLHGSLFYAPGSTVAAGPSGSVFLVASPALPGLASLTAQGLALPVATPRPIGGYLVWKVLPGTPILGVRTTSHPPPFRLGAGI